MSYALITGASKGIGKELVIALAKRKYNLLLVARSEDLLANLAQELQNKFEITVFYKALDLSEKAAGKEIYDWCSENRFTVSFLVNNAGYAMWGYFEKLSLSEQQQMLQVDAWLPVELTHYLLPVLKKNKPSYILNVASTTAYQAVPTLTLYAAAKSFMVVFSRGLRFELKNSGISVTCLSPGPVKTNFVDRAGMQVMKEQADKFGMEASVVAEIAINATLKKKAEVIPGFTNKLGAFLTRVLPKSVIESFIAAIYKGVKEESFKGTK